VNIVYGKQEDDLSTWGKRDVAEELADRVPGFEFKDKGNHGCLVEDQLDALLRFFGLEVSGGKPEKRERLAAHCGCDQYDQAECFVAPDMRAILEKVREYDEGENGE
jgi:hypothetical protein